MVFGHFPGHSEILFPLLTLDVLYEVNSFSVSSLEEVSLIVFGFGFVLVKGPINFFVLCTPFPLFPGKHVPAHGCSYFLALIELLAFFTPERFGEFAFEQIETFQRSTILH